MNGRAKRNLIGAVLFFIAGVVFFFNEKGRYMAYVFFILSLVLFAISRGGRDSDDLSHNLVQVPAKAATTSVEGNIEYWTCSNCGKLFKDSEGKIEITKADTVIPKLTPEPSDPLSGNTNNSSSVSGTDTVMPTLPAVKIAKPKAAKKSVTVKWKKVSNKKLKKIKKIQIQISPDPTFSSFVKVSTTSSKRTSKTVKGLRKGVRYFVRVRGINGGQISAWSSVKSFNSK